MDIKTPEIIVAEAIYNINKIIGLEGVISDVVLTKEPKSLNDKSKSKNITITYVVTGGL